LEPYDGMAAGEVVAEAGIPGTPAMPKGLRHSFGVNAFETSVPPHLVQRWAGPCITADHIYK
jgi:hypothetical protein